jgi:membrane-bound serine protease (ClpP class)
MGRHVTAIGRATVPVALGVGPARAGHVGGHRVRTHLAPHVVGRAPGASIASPGFDSRVQLHSPTLGDFVVNLDGRAGISIPSKVVHEGKQTRRAPQVTVRFAKPSLTARTIHGVTSPGPAYALLVFGLLLAVLEFTTAGVGLAAATGAIFLVLAALGLGGLPVHGPAVAALIFAVFGFAVDVQAGAPRVWTALGTGSMVYGSLFLFRDDMHVPIVWMLGVFGLTAAFVLAGLPSLVRARFSSPTIGREGFVGELGTAVGELAPDGVVNVRGATWRARTNRATPVADGGVVRVIGIDGLVLDVEPEEGGAKDYRERSKSST